MERIAHFKRIEKAISRNLTNRGMEGIVLEDELKKAAVELLSANVIFIVTGFVIRDVLMGETDGPIGTVSLAGALEKLGKKVVLITDKYSRDLLYKCIEIKKLNIPIEVITYGEESKFSITIMEKYKPSHIIAIERPGRALDGNCYSMRGEDLSDIIPNADILFEYAKKQGIITLAVGDGGNEIGMGKVRPYIEQSVPLGNKICATFSTDYLIIAGVSNWGGHALVAALSLLKNKMLLHDTEVEIQLLEGMISVGAVDGYSKKRTLTVDGLDLKDNIYVLRMLRNIVNYALIERFIIGGKYAK